MDQKNSKEDKETKKKSNLFIASQFIGCCIFNF